MSAWRGADDEAAGAPRSIGLILVEIACVRMLIATIEGTARARYEADLANVIVGGLASVALLTFALTTLLVPGLWHGIYDWTVTHTFGSGG